MVLGELSSGRPSCFPDGLRVLLVDHDSQSLKNLEKLLIKCNYQVTTCNLMQEALRLLRESKGGFDIVISENNMPDMDGFKFLEHVGLEMDIPIILMSANGEMSRVMRGVERGACDYLLKPIRLKELRNIWQHVLRKRMQVNEGDEIRMVRNETEETDMILGKKRKEDQNKNYDSECGHRSSVKKPRVVWTPDLHLKFVKAVNQIGLDKAGPKKILELMEVSWLKRENVASHLQKYRIHLSRIQKEEKLKITSGGVKHTHISSKDTTASDTYSRRLINQNIVTTGNYVDHGFHIHDANVWDGNPNETLSMPMALEAKNAMSGDVIDPSISTPSGMSFNQSFGEVNSRFIIQNQYTWSAKVPPLQIEQQVKPQFQPAHQFDRLSCGNNISYNYGKVTNIKNAAGFYSGRQQSHLTFDPLASCSTWSSTKNHSLDQNLPENLDFDGEFFCAQNQEPVNFELFGGISAANMYDPMIFGGENSSDPMENLVIDQGHLFNDLH